MIYVRAEGPEALSPGRVGKTCETSIRYIGLKNAIGFDGKRNRLRWQMKAASLADESGFVGR